MIQPRDAENAHNRRRHQFLVLGVTGLQHVETEWIVGISDVEVHDVGGAILRNVAQYLLNQIPMRIDKAHGAALPYIRDDHVLNQSRFSSPRFAQEVHALSSVCGVNCDGLNRALLPMVTLAIYIGRPAAMCNTLRHIAHGPKHPRHNLSPHRRRPV